MDKICFFIEIKTGNTISNHPPLRISQCTAHYEQTSWGFNKLRTKSKTYLSPTPLIYIPYFVIDTVSSRPGTCSSRPDFSGYTNTAETSPTYCLCFRHPIHRRTAYLRVEHAAKAKNTVALSLISMLQTLYIIITVLFT